MAHDTTLHTKVDSATNQQLARLAAARGTSKGRLVCDAIAACYHVPIEDLPVQQRRALAAFEGGLISIGKPVESLGMHVLEMRCWLSEHGIEHGSDSSADDHLHA